MENASHGTDSRMMVARNVRRGEHKCRILEMHMKFKDQQLKTILLIYRLLYQNLMITTNRKSTIDTRTKKKKKSKHDTKVSHQITRAENKRGREEKRPTKTNPKQLRNGNRNIHIDNYLKCKWIKCSHQKT